jgi:hypothetical protein
MLAEGSSKPPSGRAAEATDAAMERLSAGNTDAQSDIADVLAGGYGIHRRTDDFS